MKFMHVRAINFFPSVRTSHVDCLRLNTEVWRHNKELTMLWILGQRIKNPNQRVGSICKSMAYNDKKKTYETNGKSK